MRGLALSVAAALAAAACSTTKPQEQSDWERRNPQSAATTEEVVDPPAYPAMKNLLEFSVLSADGFRFYIDRASLSVSKEGLVRYVLVARSPVGVDNVSYEGLRCASAEQRLYAVARPDHSWSAARSTWRPVSTARHVTLAQDYFCPQKEPIRDAYEGILALQGGGHPFAKGFAGEAVNRGR